MVSAPRVEIGGTVEYLSAENQFFDGVGAARQGLLNDVREKSPRPRGSRERTASQNRLQLLPYRFRRWSRRLCDRMVWQACPSVSAHHHDTCGGIQVNRADCGKLKTPDMALAGTDTLSLSLAFYYAASLFHPVTGNEFSIRCSGSKILPGREVASLRIEFADRLAAWLQLATTPSGRIYPPDCCWKRGSYQQASPGQLRRIRPTSGDVPSTQYAIHIRVGTGRLTGQSSRATNLIDSSTCRSNQQKRSLIERSG